MVSRISPHRTSQGRDSNDIASHDVNQNGIADQGDFDLVYTVLGRSIHVYPEIPTAPTWPSPNPIRANRCGDLDRNGIVNAADLTILTDWMATYPNGYCLDVDVNHDGVIDQENVTVIQINLDRRLGDINGDGCVNLLDKVLLYSFINDFGQPCTNDAPYNPIYDVNCDGCINPTDGTVIDDNWTTGCPPP